MLNNFIGIKPSKHLTCDLLLQVNLMRFSGNQHNEDWSWNVEVLKLLSNQELLNLFDGIESENNNVCTFDYQKSLPSRFSKIYDEFIQSKLERDKRIYLLRNKYKHNF